MLAVLQAQQNPYLPAHNGTTSFGGHTVMFVQFAAPSQLGMLGPLRVIAG